MTNTESIEQVSKEIAPQKIVSFIASVMNEIERKSSEFDEKRAEIEQEIKRGARITKRGLHL
jgi:hypothetical protein